MYERPLNVSSCHPLTLYRVAKFRKRLVAFIIDGFILALINAFLQALLKMGLPLVPDIFLENIEAFLATFIMTSNLFYFFIYTYIGGATPGKRIIKLKIVSTRNDSQLSLTQALLRTLGYIISFLSLGLGFFASLWSKKKQCWHDSLSETAVINLVKGKSTSHYKDLVQELKSIEETLFQVPSSPFPGEDLR